MNWMFAPPEMVSRAWGIRGDIPREVISTTTLVLTTFTLHYPQHCAQCPRKKYPTKHVKRSRSAVQGRDLLPGAPHSIRENGQTRPVKCAELERQNAIIRNHHVHIVSASGRTAYSPRSTSRHSTPQVLRSSNDWMNWRN